jgi:von Willebrand factor type A domain
VQTFGLGLEFLTPIAGLIALLAVVPLGALLERRRVGDRTRRRIGLPEPRRRVFVVPGVALALAAACLGLAAMQPVVSFDEKKRVRTDAEAFFVLDTSRSMQASVTAGSPSRLARAKAAASTLRAAIPEVPAGVASITDRTLPHVFPTPDDEVFGATLQKSVGIERPPPVHELLARATRLDSLAAVATQQFFSPEARSRVLVVLTDGETLPWEARLGPLFERAPGIDTVFVQVWGHDERVFSRRTPEPGYRADPGAEELLERFALEVGGQAFSEDELAQATEVLPRLVGDGPSVVQGERRRDVALAPPLAAAAFFPLVLLLWRRDR